MSEYNAYENTIFGGYGEFESFDVTADWTDEDWAEHDAQVADDIASAEEWSDSLEYWPSPEDWAPEPPF